MSSKALPLIVGMAVLLAGAVFVLGRTIIRAPEVATLPRVGTAVDARGDAPAVGQVADSSPALIEGLQALNESRLDDARSLLARIPEDDPSFLPARFNLGIAHERAGDGEAAIAALLQVGARQDESAEFYAALGRAYSLTGRYELAERTAMRTIELDAQHVPVRYHVACIRVARGRLVDAIAAYRRALTLDPAGVHLGQAIVDLEHLHVAGPEHPDTHYALAFLANASGRRADEIVELDHYLELDPQGPAVAVAEARRKALGAPVTQ